MTAAAKQAAGPGARNLAGASAPPPLHPSQSHSESSPRDRRRLAPERRQLDGGGERRILGWASVRAEGQTGAARVCADRKRE